MRGTTTSIIAARVDALGWGALYEALWARGWAKTSPLLSAAECAELTGSYARDALFRSRVIMARHRFGEGEYKYFSDPLPEIVSELRQASYRRLAPLANEWSAALGETPAFPDQHGDFLDVCHAHGQARPTPLMLRYTQGGYNCLHQDLYGRVHFPLQMVVMLDRPGVDYTGGHFVLVETRPRAQSVAEAILPEQGEAVIFTTRTRPVRGARGFYRVTVRHGVSSVTQGERHALGVVYHDAE